MAQLPYDPSKISRELSRHYIPATEADIRAMFAAVGSKDFRTCSPTSRTT